MCVIVIYDFFGYQVCGLCLIFIEFCECQIVLLIFCFDGNGIYSERFLMFNLLFF